MFDSTQRVRPNTPPDFILTTSEEPRQLGDYRLVRKVGQGGMGVVYEAEQQSLLRRVALKILAGPGRWDEDARERFEREARSAAMLHHTNIVPIFEVGVAGDEYFYAMQFIDGIGLDALIARLAGQKDAVPEDFPLAAELASPEHPLHFRALAQLAWQVAGALAHAHVRGVVHRDIKPANLLLDKTGVVWITDFGLAKHTDDNLTQNGDVFGTIRYMAPERFRGVGDAATDIYALGATLYELATQKAAYPDVTEPAHVEKLAMDPPRPSKLDRRIPRDLETIILKAMEKDPNRRYATAQDLADDLRRFLDDEPIHARPIGAAGRTLRWAKRRPVLASLTGAVLILTATVIIGAIAAAVTFHDLAENEVRLRHDADLKTKAAVEANAASQEIAELMLGILDETDPLALSGRVFGGKGNDRSEEMKPGQVLERTLAKLEETPEIGPKVRATLLDKIGAIYVNLGKFDKGGPLLEQALKLRRAEHGDDSLEAAETWHHLGLSYLTQKSYESSEEAYGRALAIRERQLGPEHPLVTVTLMHLGIVKSFGRDGAESAVLLRRARDGLRKQAGVESREYCIAVTVLAAVLLHEGEIEEARPLLPEAMLLIQKHEGNNGLGQSIGLFLQGRLASKIGLHDQATTQYRSAIALSQKSLGPEHFLVILAHGELASHLQGNVRDLKAAEDEYVKVIALSEKGFGPEAFQTTTARMYLARVLRDQKRYEDAEIVLKDVSEVMRRRKHPSLGRCLHIYFEVQFKQGKIAESLPAIEEAVRERKNADNLAWYSHAAADLALTLEKLGRLDDAERALRESNVHLAQQPKLSPQEHWVLAHRCAGQVGFQRKLGRPEKEIDETTQTAVRGLRKALETGGVTRKELETDGRLNPIRDQRAFQQMLAETRKD